MNAGLYEEFVLLKNLGQKSEAKSVLDAFIASFQTFEEKRDWAFGFLKAEEHGHKIRHEIYENLVYPVLLEGYLKSDANSVYWLARTADNLYAVRSSHPLLKDKTEDALFTEAYGLEPSEENRERLLKNRISWFRFSEHEWPAGILYGMDGADAEECGYILEEVEFARSLDRHQQFADFLSEFEAKVHQYRRRLQDRV